MSRELEQAQKLVEAQERWVQQAYTDLCDEAQYVAKRTRWMAFGTTLKWTVLLALVLLVISVIVFNVQWIVGVIWAGCSLYIVYAAYSGLTKSEKTIAEERKKLEEVLKEQKVL